MALGPAKPLVDLALLPLRLGARVVQGVLGGEGSEAGARREEDERGDDGATTRPDPQRSTRAKPIDDVGLARKVETVIFRDPSVPKGKIDVNAADGVVWLRGEAKTPEMIKELESLAAAIPEVKKVENLLHLPKTPAPTRTDTPATQRKTRRSRPSPGKRKVSEKVTAERPVKGAEPSPAEVAAEGSGRKAAPLGASDSGDGEAPENREK